jgi:hypothetical protein
MERLPQRFCPLSELGNPQRTRVSTFPQRRRLRLSNWTQLLNPRKSNVSTDSRPEPKKVRKHDAHKKGGKILNYDPHEGSDNPDLVSLLHGGESHESGLQSAPERSAGAKSDRRRPDALHGE